MAQFWMHGAHLHVNGRKMSKSRGNIYYADTLIRKGYTASEIRFFLMYSHYRTRLNYSDRAMRAAAKKLKAFRTSVSAIRSRAGGALPAASQISDDLRLSFVSAMDNDMQVKEALDRMQDILCLVDGYMLTSSQASGIIRTLKGIDEVLQVIF